MVNQSILQTTALGSPLLESSTLKPKGRGRGRTLLASLLLTSLVDAFSILVIFLFSTYSSSGEFVLVNKDMMLPKAMNSVPIERQTIVKVHDGKLYVEEMVTTPDSLTGALLEERKKALKAKGADFELALIVQADKRVEYDIVSQIIQAGSQAGFSEIRFAVLAER